MWVDLGFIPYKKVRAVDPATCSKNTTNHGAAAAIARRRSQNTEQPQGSAHGGGAHTRPRPRGRANNTISAAGGSRVTPSWAPQAQAQATMRPTPTSSPRWTPATTRSGAFSRTRGRRQMTVDAFAVTESTPSNISSSRSAPGLTLVMLRACGQQQQRLVEQQRGPRAASGTAGREWDPGRFKATFCSGGRRHSTTLWWAQRHMGGCLGHSPKKTICGARRCGATWSSCSGSCKHTATPCPLGDLMSTCSVRTDGLLFIKQHWVGTVARSSG